MKTKVEESLASYKESGTLYYHLIKTADDSFSLCTSNKPQATTETMHSSFGAFTETEYIYGRANKLAFEQDKKNLKFLNLGLGIGYNELSIVCHCLKSKTPLENINIDSFESISALSDSFRNFYLNGPEHEFLNKVYDSILDRYSDFFKLNKQEIKQSVKSLLENDRLKLLTSMNQSTADSIEIFNVLLFDAYSSNTSPELWTPDILNSLISKADRTAVVSTYAATGALKRCLKANGFKVLKTDGFAKKRESTFATKGIEYNQKWI